MFGLWCDHKWQYYTENGDTKRKCEKCGAVEIEIIKKVRKWVRLQK